MLSSILKNFSKKIVFVWVVVFTFFSSYSIAEDQKKTKAQKNQPETEKTEAKVDYDAIMKEYKEFVKNTKPEIKDEIKKYREKVAELNKQKSTLYKELSQEAQGYLKKEKAIRFKIPVEDRREYIKRIYSDINSGEKK